MQPNPLLDAYGLDIIFRYPQNAEVIPEIAAFRPLGRYDAGIKHGKIELVNDTVLEGIDEVRSLHTGLNFGRRQTIRQIILATGYRRNTFLPEL